MAESIQITSLEEFIEHAMPFAEQGQGFRGVANSAYPLKPGIGRKRDDVSIEQVLVQEQAMFTSFKRHLGMFETANSCLDIAIIGQHYGLPTRLLDWSLTPLTALFFACKSHFDKDGIVYVLPEWVLELRCENKFYDSIIFDEDLEFINEAKNNCNENTKDFNIKEYFYYLKDYYSEIPVGKIYPVLKSSRMLSQGSFFTVHFDPFQDFSNKIEQQFIIPMDGKEKIYKQLERIGVHEYSIFPDADGLASWLRRVYFAPLA